MNLLIFTRCFTQRGRFLLLSSLAWLLVLTIYLGTDSYSLYFLGLVALSSSFSVLLLGQFGYFHVIRWHQRKSDLLSLLVAFPLATCLSASLFKWIAGVATFSLSDCIATSLPVALLTFLIDFLRTRLHDGRVPRKTVVLDVLPEERKQLLGEFELAGVAPYFRFFSRSELERLTKRGLLQSVDLIVISRSALLSFREDAVLLKAHLAGIPIVDRGLLISELSGRIPLEDIEMWSFLLEATPQTAFLRAFRFVKQYLEPLVACVLLMALSPVLVLVALAVRVSGPGPILFRQQRCGYLGKQFTLTKFRTMIIDSEKNGPQWSQRNDPRITRIGRFLRRSRLDELPQLLNVIRGEMSFFGPRPERPEICADLEKSIPLFWVRTIVRPGISGWAQVNAGYAASVAESKQKLEHDLFYIKHMSPRLDLVCLYLTIRIALFGHDAEKSALVESFGESAVSSSALVEGKSSEQQVAA